MKISPIFLISALTLSRIVLLPYLLWLYLRGEFNAAAVLFFICGLSDILDGFLARRFNLVSSTGKLLDPVADKVFILLLGSFFCYEGQIPAFYWALLTYHILGQFSCFHIIKRFAGKGFQAEPSLYSKLGTALALFVLFLVIIGQVSFEPLQQAAKYLLHPGIAISSLFEGFLIVSYTIQGIQFLTNNRQVLD